MRLKRILAFICIVVFANMTFSSCSKDKTDEKDLLIGTWKQTHVTMWNMSDGEKIKDSEQTYTYDSQGFYISFQAGGKGTRWQEGHEEEKTTFEWTLSTDRLVFDYDDRSWVSTVSFTINGITKNKMVLSQTDWVSEKVFPFDSVYSEYHYGRAD